MDSMEAMIAQARQASAQNVAFYTEHLKGLVAAYRKHMDKMDPDALLNGMMKSLMESDNTREDLCYQVVTAVDILARRQQ